MSYLKIDNLYKAQEILLFKECYAMEKLHGTSSWISYKDGRVAFFAGGSNHEEFVKLFDENFLKDKFSVIDIGKSMHVYGEAYGGKLQGMSKTYGDKLKFAAFEVKIGDTWLNVLKAEKFTRDLGLDFVHYKRIFTKLEDIDAERDSPSEQAVKNGMGNSTDKWGFCPPIREGIVLRPLEEVVLNNGKRIITKHKRDELRETKTPRPVNADRLIILTKAKEIADEWVTLERLNHILTSGVVEVDIANTGKIINLMAEDIIKEAYNEIIDTPEVRKTIGRETALMFKEYLKSQLG